MFLVHLEIYANAMLRMLPVCDEILNRKKYIYNTKD